MPFLYERLLRPLLFAFPSEDIHRFAIASLKLAEKTSLSSLFDAGRDYPALANKCLGLSFKNPIGLAAGFDKDAELPALWPKLGFGHVELGTVTGRAQPGNPKPRLFRLVADRALVNRMGFNSIGAEAFYRAFAEKRKRGLPDGAVYGINIGKSKATPLADAAQEYAATFARLAPLADYAAINVSSPNTPGLRALQDKGALDEIFAAVQAENRDRKPVLIKIAPDLAWSQIDEILDLIHTHRLSGIIATNTTTSRAGLSPQPHVQEEGGLSGAPLKARSTEVIRHIAIQTRRSLPIIGVGGVETATDAYEKILAGASLVQLYTGFIYHGPFAARHIADGLACLLVRDGFKTLAAAVGQGL